MTTVQDIIEYLDQILEEQQDEQLEVVELSDMRMDFATVDGDS